MPQNLLSNRFSQIYKNFIRYRLTVRILRNGKSNGKSTKQGRSLYFVLFGCQILSDGCHKLIYLIENFFMDTHHMAGENYLIRKEKRFAIQRLPRHVPGMARKRVSERIARGKFHPIFPKIRYVVIP